MSYDTRQQIREAKLDDWLNHLRQVYKALLNPIYDLDQYLEYGRIVWEDTQYDEKEQRI